MNDAEDWRKSGAIVLPDLVAMQELFSSRKRFEGKSGILLVKSQIVKFEDLKVLFHIINLVIFLLIVLDFFYDCVKNVAREVLKLLFCCALKYSVGSIISLPLSLSDKFPHSLFLVLPELGSIFSFTIVLDFHHELFVRSSWNRNLGSLMMKTGSYKQEERAMKTINHICFTTRLEACNFRNNQRAFLEFGQLHNNLQPPPLP
ncbi:hypothetical protein QQP08_026270 [Theobroma cacao]|nr:hypothetical protein QQP08_026270 [Theobroma cacao]